MSAVGRVFVQGIVIATVLALAFLVAPVEVVTPVASSAPATTSHHRGPAHDEKNEEPQRKKGESNKLARVLCRARAILTVHLNRPLWTIEDEKSPVALDEPRRTEHLRRLVTPPALQVFRH